MKNEELPAIGWKQVLVISMLLSWGSAMAATLGGRLELEDEGSFFVNGKSMRSEYPGASLATGPAPAGNIMVNQMYVHSTRSRASTGSTSCASGRTWCGRW